MGREAEFLYYQDLYSTYSARLREVNRCIHDMDRRKVKLTDDMVASAVENLYCDYRSDEEQITDELYKWVSENNGVCPLFDYRTLSILTGNGESSYIERNIGYEVGKIKKLSDGYDEIEEEGWKSNHGTISFDGFYNFQVDFIIAQMKKMAEDALESLRDVGTTLGYMRSYHAPLNKLFGAGPTPEALSSGKSYDDGAPVISIYWMGHAFDNEYTAGDVVGNTVMMLKMAHPDAEHPPLLTTFGTHNSNRVELNYQ